MLIDPQPYDPSQIVELPDSGDPKPDANKDFRIIRALLPTLAQKQALDAAGASVFNETPAGALNGVNMTFTLSHSFIAGSTQVYLNGMRQRLGVGWDYTESAPNQVVFSSPLVSTDSLIVDYRRV
jgi:hypothetical protein